MKALTLAVVAWAALGTARDEQVFRAQTELVTVPVSVTAREGTPRPLTARDFRVFEDGVEQAIVALEHTPRPVSVCVLLDSSPSMEADRRLMARYAVEALVRELGDEDEAAILTFAMRTEVSMPWTKARAIPAIRWDRWGRAPGSALLDALQYAFAYLDAASNPLRVIVLVSDGGENSSRTSLPRVSTTRRRSETLVFALHTDAGVTDRHVGSVVDVAEETPRGNRAVVLPAPESDWSLPIVGDSGGRVLRIQHPAGAVESARSLLAELRALYMLGYAPSRPADGRYRRIRVTTAVSGLGLRHRVGYLSAAPAKPPDEIR